MAVDILAVIHSDGYTSMAKLEVYTDRVGGHRWRLKAGNGEIVATSESYTSRYSAKKSAESVKRWADSATIVEIN